MNISSQSALFIATVVLVVITAWYATATWVMASRMKEQSDALIAPRVTLRAERRNGDAWLVLENRGLSTAREIRLIVDRPVPTKDLGVRQPLTADRLFSDRPTCLGPGETREMVLGSDAWIMENYNDYSSPFTVSASYSWTDGRSVKEDLPIHVLHLWSTAELDNATRAPDLRVTRD
jgi:hypothetical protein